MANKGADDVCSMLNHFSNFVLPQSVRKLVIFCDSCAGQNKNYTVIRYLHYVVCNIKRFDTVKIIFPIRGHSYLECDRNMSFINQKSYAETPNEWRGIIENSRVKPSPFQVVDCKQDFFQAWTKYLTPLYRKKCPMPTRPVRCLYINNNKPNFVYYRNTYFGSYNSGVISKTVPRVKATKRATTSTSNQPQPLEKLYTGPLVISEAKYKDLQSLKPFLTSNLAKEFYDSLPHQGTEERHDDVYLDYLVDDE